MINSPFNFDSASRLRISQSSSLSDLKLLGADNAMVWEALLIAASKQALLTLQINPTLSSPITRTQVAGTCLEFGLGNGTITVTSPGRIIDSKYTASLLGPNATPVLRDFVKNIGMSIADATDIHVICMTPLVATTTVSAYATLRES